MWYLRPNYLHSGIFVPENTIVYINIFFLFFDYLFMLYLILKYKVVISLLHL